MPDYATDDTCIFCKIVAGDIPCHKLHEDDLVLAFLDIGPLSRGHTLIIPKHHAVTIDQLPDASAAACMAIAPRLCRAIVEVTGATGWNILQNNGRIAGQAVDHVHFHIIPRQDDDGLGYRWPAGTLNQEDAKALVSEIATAFAHRASG